MSKAKTDSLPAPTTKTRNDQAVARWDGWKNILTGLGIMGKDKRMGADIDYYRMDAKTAEILYAVDDMAAKIVDFLPEEMIREGFDIKHDDPNFPNLQADLDSIFDELNVIAKVEEAMKWSRLYGGAGTVLGIDDGNESDTPVDLGNIRSIDFLNNLSRWELVPQIIQQDPSAKHFGMPEIYGLQPAFGQVGAANLNIHASRVVRWHGANLPRRLQIENNYWDDSVLNRVFNVLRNFQTSHDSAANLLQDFAQAVYKLKNLTEMLAMGKDDLVEKRLALVDRTRSVVNAIVLEEGEDFDRKVTSLTGLPEVLKMVNQRLVQASGLPHTILLGESPSGLGATGNSEKSDWYDYVSRQQETKLLPQLTQIVKYILLSKDGPTKGVEPKNWRLEARPLEQESLKDKLANRKTQADVDNIYVQMGALSSDEVALSRFTGSDFSFDTKLSIERTPPSEDPESDMGTDLNEGDGELADVLLYPQGNDPGYKETDFQLSHVDGGPGSGPAAAGAASEKLGSAMSREAAATEAVKAIQKKDPAGFWTKPEYHAATKEYRSAVRNRQKAVKEAKSILKGK